MCVCVSYASSAKVNSQPFHFCLRWLCSKPIQTQQKRGKTKQVNNKRDTQMPTSKSQFFSLFCSAFCSSGVNRDLKKNKQTKISRLKLVQTIQHLVASLFFFSNHHSFRFSEKQKNWRTANRSDNRGASLRYYVKKRQSRVNEKKKRSRDKTAKNI